VATTPYDIDFRTDLAVVVGGVSLPSLALAGNVVSAADGPSWGLATLPRSTTSVSLVGDGTSIVANAEGG